MKKIVSLICVILLVIIISGTSSCTKSSKADPHSVGNVKVTGCIYTYNGNHVKSIRFALQNKSDLRLYYCKVTIIISDDNKSHEVFRRTYELGSKYHQECILAPNETQWGPWYDVDFYIFNDASYSGYVEDALFY